jgi:hypothetical protein
LVSIFQAEQLLQPAITDANSEHAILAVRQNADKVDVIPVARPLLVAHPDFR